MAFKRTSGSVTSLSDLFARVRSFVTGALGWVQVHTGTQLGTAYYFYHSTGELGDKDFYIGIRSFKANDYQCGLQFAACTGIDSEAGFDGQPGGFGPQGCAWNQFSYYPVLAAVDDGTSIAYWFIGDKDFVFIVLRIGAKYLSAYVGLFNSYWSDYSLPLIVAGSLLKGDHAVLCDGCQSSYWHYHNNVVPYRYACSCMFGYKNYESHLLWLRNCNNTGWIHYFTGNWYRPSDGLTPELMECDILGFSDYKWGMIAFNYPQNRSSRSHGHVLFPIYIGSFETPILGELKYVYYSYFYGRVPSESVIYIGGDRYRVFVRHGDWSYNVSIAIRDYE